MRKAVKTQDIRAEGALHGLTVHSLDLANKSFGAHLEQHVDTFAAPKLNPTLLRDVHFKAESYTPQMLIARLGARKQQFDATVAKATNVEQLFDVCDAYVHDEIRSLCYETNDLVAARLKQDYLKSFITALCPLLKDRKIIDGGWQEKFDDLMRGYELGFDSYYWIQNKVTALSDGKAQSLLDWADQAHQQMKGREPVPQEREGVAEALAVNMGRLAHKDLNKSYGPSPVLLLLLLKSVHIAGLDMPNDATMEQAYAKARPLVKRVMNMLKNGDDWKNALDINDMLQKEYCAAEGVPAEFDRFLIAASKQAEKKAFAGDNLRKAYREAEGVSLEALAQAVVTHNAPQLLEKKAAEDAARTQTGEEAPQEPSPVVADRRLVAQIKKLQQLATPIGKPLVAAHLPFVHDKKLSEQALHDSIAYAREVWEGEYSKQEVLRLLDNQCDGIVNGVCSSYIHPAMLQVMNSYVETFRKQLGKKMHDTGMHDAGFLAGLKEVEDKYMLALESYRIAGDWLMQDTEGAYNHYFSEQGLTHMVQRGQVPQAVIAENLKEIEEMAITRLEKLALWRSIPEEVARHPLVPLLYERCRQRAEDELGGKPTAVSDKRLEAFSDEMQRRIVEDGEETKHAQETEVQKRTLELLGNALALLPEAQEQVRDMVDGKEVDIGTMRDFTAHGLREALEYIDQQSRARTH